MNSFSFFQLLRNIYLKLNVAVLKKYAIAGTSRMMLKSISERRHLCLLPGHGGKAMSFLVLIVVLAVGVL